MNRTTLNERSWKRAEAMRTKIQKALAESDENEKRYKELVRQSDEREKQEAAERSRKADTFWLSMTMIMVILIIILYSIYK